MPQRLKDLDLGNLRVLVVDDDEHLRGMIAQLLNGVGIKFVGEAGDGETALAMIAEEGRVCRALGQRLLIVSDVRMAGMNGLELLRKVKSGPYADLIKFVLMTVGANLDAVKEARTLGVDSFLAKPFSPQSLFDRLAAVLRD